MPAGGMFFDRSKAQRQDGLERSWTHALHPKGRQQDVAGQPSHEADYVPSG